MASKKTTAKKETALRGAVATSALDDSARNLSALRKVDPLLWRDKILEAFRKNEGKAVQAAEFLGIGHRTLLRIMAEEEGLSGAIEKIRLAEQAKRHAMQKQKRKERRQAKAAAAREAKEESEATA